MDDKLNDDQTESLLIASNRKHFANPPPISIHTGNTDIPFSSRAKKLGVTLSSNLSMEKHVTNVRRSAYVEIRRISNKGPNSAARPVFKARKQEHINPLLQKLHWLPVHSRIQ